MDDLSIRCDYSTIKDAALDTLIKSYKVKKPDAGFRYVRGHLRSLGIRIQTAVVVSILKYNVITVSNHCYQCTDNRLVGCFHPAHWQPATFQ